jgi:hypothetical protein
MDIDVREGKGVRRARLATLARVMGWDVPGLTPEERRIADEKYEAAQAAARRVYGIGDKRECVTP